MRPQGDPSEIVLYRAYVPRWSVDPLSGAGAALYGGRWNAIGEKTIYAALDPATAWAEYNQRLSLHPALLAALRLKGAHLADVGDKEARAALGVETSVVQNDWRKLMDAGKEPATHRLARRLRRKGYDGVIYRSAMLDGGRAVALWRWNARGAPRLSVVDPEGRLPKSPASWLP